MRNIILAIFALCASSSLSFAQECDTVADCSQKAMEAAFQAKLALELAVPKGAVMAFALESCPTGWAVYKEASGRFLRGIDIEATGADPSGLRKPGSHQEDSLQNHSHSMPKAVQSVEHAPGNKGGQGYMNGPYGNNVGATTVIRGDARHNSEETRARNVAVLFCVRN